MPFLHENAIDPLDELLPIMAIAGREVPQRSPEAAMRFLDSIGCPYVRVGPRRFYQLRKVRAAIERNQVMPPATA
jgi:hypothetical protein